jgi:hypothetical protein
MRYVVAIGSGVMVYLSSFMRIGTGIRAILRLLPQQFERL